MTVWLVCRKYYETDEGIFVVGIYDSFEKADARRLEEEYPLAYDCWVDTMEVQ